MRYRVFLPVLVRFIIFAAAVNAQVPAEIDYTEVDRRSAARMVVQSAHSSAVMCTAYSPDGRFLASGGYDNTVKLWNVENGKMIRNFRGHDGIIKDAAFSPDGMRLATAGMDGTVRIWGIDGSLEAVMDGHMFGAVCVAFSADGKLIASGGEDCTLKIWDSSGALLESVELGYSPVMSVAFSPDPEPERLLLATADDDLVKLWSPNGRLLRVLEGHTDDVKSVAFSPDGKYILSAGDDSRLLLWSRDGELTRTFAGHASWVEEAVFSPDGRSIASAGMENVIKLWKTGGGCIRDIEVQSVMINCLAFRPDGRQLAAGSLDVRLRNLEGVLERTLSGASNRIDALTLSPDGGSFATSDNTTVKLWALTGEPLRNLRAPGQFVSAYYSLAYSPDGRYLAGGGLYQGVKLWSMDGRYIRSFPESENIIRSIAFSPDGLLLAAGGDDVLKIWDVNGELIRTLPGHEGWKRRLEQLAYSPDGRYLASCGNTTIRLMGPDGIPLRTWEAARSSLKCIAFSPDGTKIASGGFDKKVRVYNLNGELLQEMSGHSNCVTALGFSPDGNSLWSAGMDGRIIRWDNKGGKTEEMSSLAGNVNSLFLTPDGRYVLYSTSNTAAVFDTKSAERYSLAVSQKEWIIFSPDGCFDASKSGSDLVAVVKGMTDYAVDQFAVINNRPDLLLSRMGLGDPELLNYFCNLYRKRLRRLGIKESELSTELHVPQASILETKQKGKHLTIAFELADEEYALSRYNLYVNDVPLLGAFGREIATDGRQPDGRSAIRLEETVELSAGENKVEISCLNETGSESYRALTSAYYDGEVRQDLYFLGFGVSEYRDPRLRLQYADKDARDLAALFSAVAGEHFREVHIKTVLNRDVSAESIRNAGVFFRDAGVDDTFVLFIAGHGVHDTDQEATYYYLTHEADVNNLSGTSAPFELIEELLHGIAPRRKLFLMDTCESGEVEPELQQRYYSAAGQAGLAPRTVRGISLKVDEGGQSIAPKKQQPSKPRTYFYAKDRYICNDLLRRSGAIVFSSSKGGEFSYESDRIENGFFTDAIIRCLTERTADSDWDGLISTDELRSFVSRTVARATDGLQHPTVDRDNIYQKFGFPIVKR